MDPRPIQGFLFNKKGNLIVLKRYEDSVRIMFINLPQYYRCKPVDEVIRRKADRRSLLRQCYGRKPVDIYFEKVALFRIAENSKVAVT